MAKNFVCVRIQSMNGVNLDQFQFEYDLTWMSFFQDGDGGTYARYGGRDDSGPEAYLNKKSLLHTMRQVMVLHKQNATQTPSRFEPKPDAKTKKLPSEIPTMLAMMSKRKDSSCIHCHDVKVAKLRHQHELGTIRKDMVFTYPSPMQLGFDVNKEKQNQIASVSSHSPAEKAGLQVGDTLIASEGQRLLTYADLTRVLELSPSSGALSLVIERSGRRITKALQLPEKWRVSPDPSWRASLHTVGPGAGFWGRPANVGERKQLKLGPDDLALKVNFVWAPHAKAAKVRNGDVVIDLDGEKKNMNMRQVHGFLHLHRN